METMQRLIAVVTIASLTLAVGCGTAPQAADGNTVTIWETYNSEEHAVFEALARDFEREYAAKTGREVRLDLQRVPYEGLLP